MRIYSCPTEVPAPEIDFRNYNHDREMRREEEHRQQLAQWLRTNGYPGANTGRICSFPVADGKAMYMVAEKGRSVSLIHLPYGDAWQYRDVQFLPKDEILRRCDAEDRLRAFFARRD